MLACPDDASAVSSTAPSAVAKLSVQKRARDKLECAFCEPSWLCAHAEPSLDMEVAPFDFRWGAEQLALADLPLATGAQLASGVLDGTVTLGMRRVSRGKPSSEPSTKSGPESYYCTPWPCTLSDNNDDFREHLNTWNSDREDEYAYNYDTADQNEVYFNRYIWVQEECVAVLGTEDAWRLTVHLATRIDLQRCARFICALSIQLPAEWMAAALFKAGRAPPHELVRAAACAVVPRVQLPWRLSELQIACAKALLLPLIPRPAARRGGWVLGAEPTAEADAKERADVVAWVERLERLERIEEHLAFETHSGLCEPQHARRHARRHGALRTFAATKPRRRERKAVAGRERAMFMWQ